MDITAAQLENQLDQFGRHRMEIVAELAHEGPSDGIGAALMLALGSRETGLQNIAGDGGHGRGWLQIDDRFHNMWLSQHRGCVSGTYTTKFASALPAGRVPALTSATLFATELLRANMRFGLAHGVPKNQCMRFAIAAYNAGAGGALKGFQRGDMDSNTAHGDYSTDVLARAAVVRRYLKRHKLPV